MIIRVYIGQVEVHADLVELPLQDDRLVGVVVLIANYLFRQVQSLVLFKVNE